MLSSLTPIVLYKNYTQRSRLGQPIERMAYMCWINFIFLCLTHPHLLQLICLLFVLKSSLFYLWNSYPCHVSRSRLKYLLSPGVIGNVISSNISIVVAGNLRNFQLCLLIKALVLLLHLLSLFTMISRDLHLYASKGYLITIFLLLTTIFFTVDLSYETQV